MTIVDLTFSDSDEDSAPPSSKARLKKKEKPPLFSPENDSDDGSSDEIELLDPKPVASTSKLPAIPSTKVTKRKAPPLQQADRKRSALSTSSWTCSACTFSNPLAYLQCEICATVRPSQSASVATFSGPRASQNLSTDLSWYCHVCAEENPHDRWSCGGCSNIKLSS